MESFKVRLKEETQDLAIKVNKLQDFMRTKTFYELNRKHKNLLYAQLHFMLEYLKVLGIRCELLEIKLDIGEEK